MPPDDTHHSKLPLLLKIPEASFQLSVCERQVYDLAKQGLLDLVKVGAKSSRITTASVLRLAARRALPSARVPGLTQYAGTEKTPRTITAAAKPTRNRAEDQKPA